jgi:hypothetical protein
MKEELKRSKMFVWGDNYFITEVYSIGAGERFVVKYCIDEVWKQRNFYSPKRVISFYRSLRKAGLTPCVVPLQHHGKVLDELQSVLQHSLD